MKLCTRCLMPDTRPRVVFKDGVCNACLYRDEYEKTDWAARKEAFRELLAAHRGDGPYDCIVPFSGGKDSAAIAWRLKHEYGAKPLLVTYGQLLWTDVGRRNWHRVRDAGFDILYWGVDQVVSRKLARRFLIERGHPKQHYDAAVNAVPVITAKKFGVPLVIYAEHGESFYGGHVLSEEHRRRRDLAEVLENQVGDDARNWAVDGLTERDLFPYIYPDDVEGIEAVYWSWYHRWDIYENAKLMRDKLGFETRSARSAYASRSGLQLEKWWGRSDGSFEGFDSIDDKIDGVDFFLMYHKFGFGRTTRVASRMIQCGHMSRADGLILRRCYDGEVPEQYGSEVCEYLGVALNTGESQEIVERHRNPAIFIKEGGRWLLKNQTA
jgi:N-acetyl sugar amidotransferase